MNKIENIKKTCFLCGKKTNKLIDGKCEDCFKKDNPPIKELKPIKATFCNDCKSIKFQNTWYSQEEFKKKIPQIVKKNLILNEHYILKKLDIYNLEIESNKVNFEIEIESDLE